MSETVHDKLINALHEYFIAHQQWELKQTHTAAKDARKWLSVIKVLARMRRDEIQGVRKQKPKTLGKGVDMAPINKIRLDRIRKKKNQNDTGTAEGNDI